MPCGACGAAWTASRPPRPHADGIRNLVACRPTRRDREGFGMQCWDVLAADATGKTDPRVVFSTAEARRVMIGLAAAYQLGDPGVHERAIIDVARGSIVLTSARGATTCSQ